MATKRKFKSDMSETIHSAAAMLHKVGAMDKTTMLDFDARHLVPSEMAPAENQAAQAAVAKAAVCRSKARPASARLARLGLG